MAVRLLCRVAAVSHRAHRERQAARLMRVEMLPEVCSTAQAEWPEAAAWM